jgi:transcriptional regulator with XRE-family HTH domain
MKHHQSISELKLSSYLHKRRRKMPKIPSLREKVCKNIREARDRKGWSQAELARRCRVTPRYISSLEKDSRNLTLETLETICTALGVTVDELLGTAQQAKENRLVAIDLAMTILRAARSEAE